MTIIEELRPHLLARQHELLEEIGFDLSRVDGKPRTMLRCPFHEDKTPSLSWRFDEGRGKCFSCSWSGDVIDAFAARKGTSVADAVQELARRFLDGKAPPPKPAPPKQEPPGPSLEELEAEAAACAAAMTGKVLAQLCKAWHIGEETVERFRLGWSAEKKALLLPIISEGKVASLCFRGTTTKDRKRVKKVWRSRGAKVALYNADELAERRDAPVLLLEGERDVLEGHARFPDHVVTSSTGGSSSFTRKLAQRLAGRTVTAWYDNDEPGQKGADKAARFLVETGATVRVVDWTKGPAAEALAKLPEEKRPGADVADCIAAGIPDEALKAIVEDAQAFEPPAEPTSGTSGTGDPQENEHEFPDPEPLPPDLPAVAPFNYSLLPESLRPWVADIAERLQCPPDFAAVGAMIGVAALVGRKVGIRPKLRDDWTVIPNLWGAIIGPVSLMKTPALLEVQKPLVRLEIKAKQEFEAQVRDREAADIVAKVTKKESENKIRDAVQSGNEIEAARIARDSITSQGEPPTRRRYIVNDSTVPKLGELLSANANGVLLFRDELIGFLKSLEQEGHESDRAFFLEAWAGTGRFTYDRIGRGTIDIEAAIVSIIGSIQPGPLMAYLHGALAGGTEADGLIQRFQLAVWPDMSDAWENIDRWPHANAKARAFETFERLEGLSPEMIGATGDPDGVPFLRFDGEASIRFTEWRTELEAVLRAQEEHPALLAHLAKFRSLIPSLALLIHLADAEGGPVRLGALEKALAWARYLESHARRIYAIASNPEAVAGRMLAKHLLRGELPDRFTLRKLYRHHWTGLATRDDAERAVGLLVDLNWLHEVRQPGQGRTGTLYYVSPKIHGFLPGGGAKSDKSPPEVPSGTSGTAPL